MVWQLGVRGQHTRTWGAHGLSLGRVPMTSWDGNGPWSYFVEPHIWGYALRDGYWEVNDPSAQPTHCYSHVGPMAHVCALEGHLGGPPPT